MKIIRSKSVFGTALILLAVAVVSIACGSEDPEQVAAEVALDWTNSAMGEVANVLAKVVTGDTPLLESAASSAIREQIKNKTEWNLSTASRLSKDRYQVVAGSRVPIDIDVLALKWSSIVSADFNLSIDTRTRWVVSWNVVPSSFAVSSTGGGTDGIDVASMQQRGRELLEKAMDAKTRQLERQARDDLLDGRGRIKFGPR